MAKGSSVYRVITDQIIALLDRGEIPWRKPWSFKNHYSLATKKKYNGINPFVLDTVASLEGYKSNVWCTFKQVAQRGGKVRKGEGHSAKVVWWHFVVEEDDDGVSRVKFARPLYSMVWNADQIDWEDESVLDFVPEEETPNEGTEVDIDTLLFANMADVEITHGGNSACYWPKRDKIGMPDPDRFEGDDEYYSTLYHELTHATGHKKRLGRFEGKSTETRFGSKDYSFEELIAEFGAAFLCAQTGIDDVRVIENSAAYIAGWKSKLTENPRWLLGAASKGRKATEYILDEKEVPVEEDELVLA